MLAEKGKAYDAATLRAAGVVFIRTGEAEIKDDTKIAAVIREQLPQAPGSGGVKAGKIVITVVDSKMTMARKDGPVYGDIKASITGGKDIPSYLILDSAQSGAGQTALEEAVRSLIQQGPGVLAAGGFAPNSLDAIAGLLGNRGFIRVIKSLTEALSQILNAIRQTAMSA